MITAQLGWAACALLALALATCVVVALRRTRRPGMEHDGPWLSWPRWLTSCGRDRTPDFDIGPGYLQRWWLLPRNPLVNVYVHRILKSDDDRALHDHPWLNCSIVLRGEYREVLPITDKCATPFTRVAELPMTSRRRRAGAVVIRRSTAPHRLVVEENRTAWTLFITGPVLRNWGFHCAHGWRHWRDFTAAEDKARVGRGCGGYGANQHV